MIASRQKGRLSEIFSTVKILEEEGIGYFEKNVPLFIIKFIYDLLWKIVYCSKLLAKIAKKKNINARSIKIALTICLRNFQEREDSKLKLNNLTNSISSILNSEKFCDAKSKFSTLSKLVNCDLCRVKATINT